LCQFVHSANDKTLLVTIQIVTVLCDYHFPTRHGIFMHINRNFLSGLKGSMLISRKMIAPVDPV